MIQLSQVMASAVHEQTAMVSEISSTAEETTHVTDEMNHNIDYASQEAGQMVMLMQQNLAEVQTATQQLVSLQ